MSICAGFGPEQRPGTFPEAAHARWVVTATGVDAVSMRWLDGPDGAGVFETRGGARALVNAERADPASSYLYFDVANPEPIRNRPVYVTVEYFDGGIGGAIGVEYDSATGDSLSAKYLPADDQAGGFRTGSSAWRTAHFELKRPLLQNRQNLGADFRLTGGRLCVRSITLSSSKPREWDRANRIDTRDIKPLVKIGEGGQLIVGGFDPARTTDAARTARALEAAIPALKSLGVTSHEGYVRWNLCEPRRGEFDWSVYDRFVEVYRRHGLKWVPFLIVGAAYSLPDWFYRKAGFQGYVCLEHGEESDVQSLWNPAMKEHVRRFIAAFCERYRDSGVIESILLGVTGNYGEAIYPATGNDWTADIHGPYHTHAGMWAGDPYALESFQLWLVRKYGGSDRFRDAWGPKYSTITQAKPLLRKDAPTDRAWLDICDWYIESMTGWSRFWLEETRRNFEGPIYLCTGGHAPPEHGADFGEQCLAAAGVNGGVRITNEASDYKTNFALTRWVASAGRQYNAYFSFEPAGSVNSQGVIARIYNATASGARGLHYYFPNLFDSDPARENFVKWGGQFRQCKPIVEIAVYYPQTHIKLNGNDFLRFVQPLRDRFDFDYLSDGQIEDGGLEKHKALILLHGNTSESRIWRLIQDWVQRGGTLLYPEGMGRLRTVEGDESIHAELIGPGADAGKGKVFRIPGRGDSPEYRGFVTRALADSPTLSESTRAMLRLDGEEDNVFVTVTAPAELLWLNYTDRAARKDPLTLPPYSIIAGGR